MKQGVSRKRKEEGKKEKERNEGKEERKKLRKKVGIRVQQINRKYRENKSK